MGVSGTPCEQRGCLDPSPYPLPWTWTGPLAGRQSAQDGPGRLQEGSREAKMASKIAQDSPTWFEIVFNSPPRALKIAPGRLQVPSEPPQEASKMPKTFKNIVFLQCFLHYRLFASDGLLMPQDGSKMPQRGPQDGPRRPQYGPKSAQERPNRRF